MCAFAHQTPRATPPTKTVLVIGRIKRSCYRKLIKRVLVRGDYKLGEARAPSKRKRWASYKH
ncbi:30S ribosomal protein S17 [Candidatus Hodgkinia cicadicola]|nr:30S ribosomal protein S17 [Candidatus Hodgkinia cicadicola]